MKKEVKVTHTEYGYDFISLYFKTLNEANFFAEKLYRKLKLLNFEHIDLQRKNFMHIPGDVPHFHSDGCAKELWPQGHAHFHVLYPYEPTEADWEYLYKMANDKNRKIRFDRNLETREVKRG